MKKDGSVQFEIDKMVETPSLEQHGEKKKVFVWFDVDHGKRVVYIYKAFL